jgi:hypothetical protein
MRFCKAVLVAVALVLWPIMSFAQPAAKPDPGDAAASVPMTRYDSAFRGYQAYQEQQPGAWREQNDEVGRVGGHAQHRQDSMNDPHAEPGAPTLSSPPRAPDHDRYK